MNKYLVAKYEQFVKFLSRKGFRKFKSLIMLNRVIQKNLVKFYYNKHRKDKVIIEGQVMYLDKKDSLNLSLGNFEDFEKDLVKRLVKKGDTVLDVGANIGYYTLIFAKLVGKNGKVYAFEPDIDNFRLLQKNVRINNHKNVITINKAVGDYNKKIRLYRSKENMGNHKIYDDHSSRDSIEVKMMTLDKFKNRKIDFIKIDVEGAEPAVIKGGKNLFLKNKPIIFTEFYPLLINQFGTDWKKYLRDLSSLEFEFYLINEKKNVLNKIKINKIQKITTPLMGNHINLLCVPKSLGLNKFKILNLFKK